MEGSDRWGEPLSSQELFAAEAFGNRISRRDGVVWLALGGELDVFTAPDFRDALEEAMPTGSESVLVLDLRGLTFLDSSGLAVILGAHERLSKQEGAELRILIQGSAPVEALFATIGAGDYLPLVEDAGQLSAVRGS